MTQEEAIKIWVENNIHRGEMEFSAGGDSMNDYTISLFDKDDEIIENPTLVAFLEDEIFKHVTFYVNSDGHYIGECGIVHIEFDEENGFSFLKSSQSEWNESITNTLKIKLTKEQADFIRKNVENINGGDGEIMNINYSRDFIMTDKDEETQKSIAELVDDETNKFTPDIDEDISDWFRYESSDELLNKNNELLIEITNEYTIYTDSDGD